jgi:hypothetical protein
MRVEKVTKKAFSYDIFSTGDNVLSLVYVTGKTV